VNDAGNGWVNTNAVPNANLTDMYWGGSIMQFTKLYAADSQNVFFIFEVREPQPPYRWVGKWNGTSLVSLGYGLNKSLISMSGTSSRNVYFVGSTALTTAYNLTGNLTISGIVKWG
jgi:hypothetical protein